MILSEKDITTRVVSDPERVQEAKTLWEQGDWASIGNELVIDPFRQERLGPCSYDLSVGAEYVSLRSPRDVIEVDSKHPIRLQPLETVLILTEEYMCLPTNLMAMVVPRARLIFEGTSICPTRIEPSWYGKLLVGFTNLSKNEVILPLGEAFCTCYFAETSEVTNKLRKETTPHLGRVNIGFLPLAHAQAEELRPRNGVTLEDLETLVKTYGKPWDIVRGAISLTEREVKTYIDRDIAPNIVKDAMSQAVTRAFDRQDKLIANQNMWLKILIVGILGIILAAVASPYIKALLSLPGP